MAFAKSTGTATNVADLVAKTEAFLRVTLGWGTMKSGSENGIPWHVMSSIGELGTEGIHLGISGEVRTTALAGFVVWLYTGYDAGCDFCNQPGAICCGGSMDPGYCAWAYLPGFPMEDSPTTYWFFGDKDMFIVVTKTGSRYHMMYTGLVERFNEACDDCYPIGAFGSSGYFIITGKCADEDSCAFPFGISVGSTRWYWMRDRADASWIESYGFRTMTSGSTCLLAMGMYQNLEGSPSAYGGGSFLAPMPIETSGDAMRGCLKYAYQIPNYGLSPEEVISVGGNDYIVFPDTCSPVAQRKRWVAIRNY